MTTILYIVLTAIMMAVVVCLPLYFINRRLKMGKTDVRKPLMANMALFFATFAVVGTVCLTQGVSATSEAMLSGSDISTAVGYLSAALAVGISGLAGGKAVATSAAAAIGALAEDDSTFGKALVFVGMAEGIALYGMLVAFIIISNL